MQTVAAAHCILFGLCDFPKFKVDKMFCQKAQSGEMDVGL